MNADPLAWTEILACLRDRIELRGAPAVARAAGISHQTLRAVLAGGRVRERTRERLRQYVAGDDPDVATLQRDLGEPIQGLRFPFRGAGA